jgi:hypothetical protein
MRKNLMRLLDSFAWIEYFIGSKRGSKVRDYVEGENPYIHHQSASQKSNQNT